MYKRLYCTFTYSFQSMVYMISSEGPAIERLPVQVTTVSSTLICLRHTPLHAHIPLSPFPPNSYLNLHTYPPTREYVCSVRKHTQTRTHTHTHRHAHTHTGMHTHTHTDTHTHTHIDMHTQMHTYTDAHTDAQHAHARTYAHRHAHTHARTHAHMHAHI